jgi:Yip1 domain
MEPGESVSGRKDLGPLQALGRVAGVFYAPRRTAAEIRDSPNWVFPLLLSMVLSFLVAGVLFSRPEWQDAFRKSLAASPKKISELEKVQLLGTMETVAWVAAVAAVAIGNLFLALLLWGAVLIREGRARFVTVFSLQLHAQMVTLLPQALGVGLLLARRGGELDAEGGLPFNLAYFLPSQGVSPFLRGAATALDLFTLWYWALVLVGLPIVAGLPRRKILLPVILLLSLMILMQAAAYSLPWPAAGENPPLARSAGIPEQPVDAVGDGTAFR